MALKWWAEAWVSDELLAHQTMLPKFLKDLAPPDADRDTVTLDSWHEQGRHRNKGVKLIVFGFADRKGKRNVLSSDGRKVNHCLWVDKHGLVCGRPSTESTKDGRFPRCQGHMNIGFSTWMKRRSWLIRKRASERGLLSQAEALEMAEERFELEMWRLTREC